MTDTPDPAPVAAADTDRVDPRLARHGAVSYLHIPATDPGRSARFYETAFGWTVHDHDSARRAAGGEIVTAPYPEGNLLVAVVRDPAGNAVGLWQETT